VTKLSGSQLAAALHGITQNENYPEKFRLQAALQVLDAYETEAEMRGGVTPSELSKEHQAIRWHEDERERLLILVGNLTAERDALLRSVDAHRSLANDSNKRLRSQLLAALGVKDDGRTSLDEYVAELVRLYYDYRDRIS